MPVKLTSREYRIIGITAVIAAVCLAVSIRYFSLSFPEASIDFKVDRQQSSVIAEQFLTGHAMNPAAYRHASAFDYDETAKLYIERTQGLEKMNQLTRPGGLVPLWRWSHRWFKPLEKEELFVDVTPAGNIAGFQHAMAETAPGANLNPTTARQTAEEFLSKTSGRVLTEFEFLDSASEKLPNRTDHTFTWKDTKVNLGDGSQRIQVFVSGSDVSGYRQYIDIPDEWQREYEQLRSRNTSAQVVDEVFWILLSIAMVVVLLQRLRHRDVPVRLALGFGLVAIILAFLDGLNTFSLAQFAYSTTDTYSGFIAGYLLRTAAGALGMGIAIFLIVAAAEPVYREGLPQLPSIGRTFTWTGLRSRSFFMANVVGIGMTFFFFAYQTVFYLAANKLGAWAPLDVPFSDQLNTAVPWIAVLLGGFAPAVLEEMQFRTFAIPFLGRVLRYWPAAIVLAAFNWGFLHSAYPNQPFFIRGVEVGIGGVIVGVLMLRFGVIATMIWHYSVDAIYTAFLLIRSTNPYLKFSGALTGGIMLLPLAIALIAYLRSGTFTDDAPVSNAAQGTRRLHDQMPPPETDGTLGASYMALDRRKLVLGGILIIAFVAIAILLPVHRFGESARLGITRQGAVDVSEMYLAQRHVAVGSYRKVASLLENVDAGAVKYLFEHQTVQDADRTYTHATRLLLWQVRYFQPEKKEEHWVAVDASTGEVFAYRHILDENAPGASLSEEEARTLAQTALAEHGYPPADFELESSEAEQRKARQDYMFIWQAKPGDPRNVGDARYRIQVDIAGDEVAGLSRQFKLPEEWIRQREAGSVLNTLLLGLSVLFAAGILAGIGILFVTRVRSGRIRWAPAGKLAIPFALIAAVSTFMQLSTLDQQYDTSIPLSAFHLYAAVGIFVTPLLTGLIVWLLIGLCTSIYPEAWNVFGDKPRGWRRDAAFCTVLIIAATAAAARIDDLFVEWFHRVAPVNGDLLPDALDAYLPGLTFFLRGLVYGATLAMLAGILIYLVRLGANRRRWWFVTGIVFLLVSLGPANARSLPEYLVAWFIRFIPMALLIFVVAAFFRNNLLAYVSAAVALTVFNPAVSLFSQTAPYFKWNGALLAGLLFLLYALAAIPAFRQLSTRASMKS
jgi:membrane protease YdiL (CAAX protease family)